MSDSNDVESATAMVYVARHHHRLGDMDDAEKAFACAAARFRNCGQEREWAIARGGVADILKARGQFDAALNVLRKQVLPVLEHFDDASAKAVTQGKIADILKSCGQLDEALRIHREEELPVHDRLGDLGEKVVTLGKIAAILQTRGQLTEALELQEQRMPIARRLGDIDSLAHIMFSTAWLRLESGERETGGLPRIHDELAEAFAISVTLSRPDFIAGTGLLLAQVLAMGGRPDPALVVLAQAEKAFTKLDDAVGLAHVRELRATIGGA
ncbi:tetratricopeptide repeat protein [Candidatus Accumulibacter sp. ACC003]|uniref:tetratricopeptide repeat protein n=1 Tax=Candidatus Accumulibacter sp. ACC003 TaxID=2823334 RepID=UPI0025BACD22|nr:tetratricopeptide repeat protein [Candidatus Accumulibacter sp. ACC003]